VTLDHLRAELDRLSPEELPDAIGALEAARAHAWARLTRPLAIVAPTDEADATVDVKDAVRLLGMSPSWLYRNAKRLPFARRVGGRAVRFSTSGIRRYLASRGG
jgi:predicted DNA-binding transcriptional regulator AlpA